MFHTSNESVVRYAERKNLELPKFMIDDIVTFHEIPYNTYFYINKDTDIINTYKNEPFKIIEKFYYRNEWSSVIEPLDTNKNNIIFDDDINDDDINNFIFVHDKHLKKTYKEPSYKPKKINRVIENKIFNDINYDCLNIRIYDEIEFENFINFLKKININLNYLWRYYSFPYCFTIFTKEFKSFKPFMLYNSENGEHMINGEFLESYDITDRQLLISPIFSLYKFIKLFNNKPDYKPKKNLRLLESSSKYPYRFKTEKEMIKDYGYNWRSVAFGNIGWNPIMDDLLGKDYPYDKYSLNFHNMNAYYKDERIASEQYYYDHRSWVICWDMLTPNIILPSYKPKKNLRLLESYSKYPYNSIFIIFNNIEEVEEFKIYMPKIQYNMMDISEQLIENIKNEFIIRKNPVYFSYKIVDNKLRWDGWSGLYYLEEDKRRRGYTIEKLFTIKDVKNGLFKQIEENGSYRYKPSYKPKKNIRLLESIDNNFSSVVFVANNNEEAEHIQTELFNNSYKWYGGNNVKKFSNGDFPVYLFAENKDNTILYMKKYDLLDEEKTINEFINKCNIEDNENIVNHVFNFNDVKNIKHISKYGYERKPIYKGKINKRTL